jgi:hypothetical protein
MPFTPVGDLFHFVTPPLAFFAVLAILIGAYLVLAEVVKNWFYKRYAYRLEQVLIPKRRAAFYLGRTARLVQDMVAVMCLRFENEISIDSLLEDLSRSVSYPVNSDQVLQNLQHLRRAGLISVDWHRRTIKRERPMKEYVTKRVMVSDMWPNVVEDWLKISKAIQDTYGKVNMEYQELLTPKQR